MSRQPRDKFGLLRIDPGSHKDFRIRHAITLRSTVSRYNQKHDAQLSTETHYNEKNRPFIRVSREVQS